MMISCLWCCRVVVRMPHTKVRRAQTCIAPCMLLSCVRSCLQSYYYYFSNDLTSIRSASLSNIASQLSALRSMSIANTHKHTHTSRSLLHYARYMIKQSATWSLSACVTPATRAS